MSLEAVTKAREAEKNLRARFEMQKEKEWNEVSASAHSAVVEAVLAARNAGVPVTQIAKAYGTSNRGTIYEILREGKHLRDLTTPEGGQAARVEALPETDENPNPHRVTLPNGDVVDVYVYEGKPGVINTPDVQHTYDLMDKTGPVWDALVQAGVIAQDKEA